MTTPRPAAQTPAPAVPLLQRAALQTQANRYAHLQKVTRGNLIQRIVNA